MFGLRFFRNDQQFCVSRLIYLKGVQSSKSIQPFENQASVNLNILNIQNTQLFLKISA